jgi:hypothetical protein
VNLRFVDLRLGDSLAVMLSGQVQRRASKDWAKPSMSCQDRGPGGGNDATSICLRTHPAIPASDWFFDGSLFSYGTGSTGPKRQHRSGRPVGRRGLSRLTNRSGKLAAVAMPIRGDHFVALGGQVKMPSGEVDRFQQVGILAKDSRGPPRCPRKMEVQYGGGTCRVTLGHFVS